MQFFSRDVQLWLDNEEGSYRELQRQARSALEDACDGEACPTTARTSAERNLGAWIKEWVSESRPEVDGMWGDIIQTAFDQIDFDELAEHYLQDFDIFEVQCADKDSELFLSFEDAVEHLEEKLDDDNTMHASSFVKLASLKVDEPIEIDGSTYVVKRHGG